MIALVTAVLLVDANAENGTVGWAIWLAASLVVGLGIGRWEAGLLPLIAVPLAIPFGYSDEYLGSDSPLVLFFAAIVGAESALLIVAGTALRRWSDRRRRERSSSSKTGPYRAP